MNNKLYKYILWLGGFIYISAAQAQLNENDSVKLQVRLSTTGSYLDGNINRLLLLNRLEVALANKQFGISSRNDHQYGRTFHRLTEKDLTSWNFIYINPLHRWYPYVMFLYEKNYRREIIDRYQPGIGVTYNILHHQKEQLLKVSLTGSFEHSVYSGTKFQNHEDTTSNTINTWRATMRVFGKHQLAKGKAKVFYEFWFQQSVTDRNNFRFFNEEGIEWPLTKMLSAKAGLRYTFEHVELEGKKPYDTFFTYGLLFNGF